MESYNTLIKSEIHDLVMLAACLGHAFVKFRGSRMCQNLILIDVLLFWYVIWCRVLLLTYCYSDTSSDVVFCYWRTVILIRYLMTCFVIDVLLFWYVIWCVLLLTYCYSDTLSDIVFCYWRSYSDTLSDVMFCYWRSYSDKLSDVMFCYWRTAILINYLMSCFVIDVLLFL